MARPGAVESSSAGVAAHLADFNLQKQSLEKFI
jgi:hypothetical protein